MQFYDVYFKSKSNTGHKLRLRIKTGKGEAHAVAVASAQAGGMCRWWQHEKTENVTDQLTEQQRGRIRDRDQE